MSIVISLYNEILYRPLFNGLIFLYNTLPLHDLGLSIIVLTIVIRFILYPLNQKAIRSQKKMGELQPQIKEVQAKYKNDKVAQSQALMELYKKNNINPAAGCLPLLIQFPVLIALYQALLHSLKPESLSTLYSFVAKPGAINVLFFGVLDLSRSNYLMAILAGALTFVQSKMMMPKTTSAGAGDFSAAMSKQMTYLMPLVTVFIAWKLPAGLALYWAVITLFGIVQQYLVARKS